MLFFVLLFFPQGGRKEGNRTGHVSVLKTPPPSSPLPQQRLEEVRRGQSLAVLAVFFFTAEEEEEERRRGGPLDDRNNLSERHLEGSFSTEMILYCPQISVRSNKIHLEGMGSSAS